MSLCLLPPTNNPIPYTQLFKACSSHIAHGAKTESVCSIAGILSDLGQDSHHLQVEVRVNSNQAAYDPDWETIFKRYKSMFGASFEDLEIAEGGRWGPRTHKHTHKRTHIHTNVLIYTSIYNVHTILFFFFILLGNTINTRPVSSLHQCHGDFGFHDLREPESPSHWMGGRFENRWISQIAAGGQSSSEIATLGCYFQ